jgi:hypothetical protein
MTQQSAQVSAEVLCVVTEAPEGGYIAEPVGAAIVAEADDLSELKQQVRDAVACHYGDAMEHPTAIRLHFVRGEVIAA